MKTLSVPMGLIEGKSRAPRARRALAFSLVEVSLALGVVAFALVGIIGALPAAMNTGRQSIAQTRAAAIANTLFASFRAQPFTAVRYVDAQFSDADGWTPGGAAPAALDLSQLNSTGQSDGAVTFNAVIMEPTDANSGVDARRIRFYDPKTGTPPATSTGPYQITLRFSNQPAGMMRPGLANGVEVAITALGQPRDMYRFSSVIANR